MSGMKIIELKAENVMCISLVQLNPDGSLIVIGGNNESGKSTLLNCIEFGLAGKKSMPAKPVREGEKKARIEIVLSDGQTTLVVQRIIEDNGRTALKITMEVNGITTNVSSPQVVLNEMLGSLAFDPQKFSRSSGPEQVTMLKELLGLDFSDLDAQEKKLFDGRTEINRGIKTIEANIEACEACVDAPDEVVSMQAILDELGVAEGANRNKDDLADEVDEIARLLRSREDAVDETKSRIKDLRIALQEASELLDNQEANKVSADKILEKRLDEFRSLESINLDPIKQRISTCEETNRQVRSKQKHKALTDSLQENVELSQALSEKIEGIRHDRKERLAEAPWPVEGLAFADGEVLYEELPLNQASSARQLRISAAIGAAQNPKLRVMIIREGSLLDPDGLQAVAEVAEDLDLQIWLERVSVGEECSVIIKDGTIQNPKAPLQLSNQELLA